MPDTKPQFIRSIPILYVRDLDAEIAFYLNFGFEISYQGDEFPGFVGLRCERFEFGLQARGDFDPNRAKASFVWLLEVDSFRRVIDVCKAHGYEYSEPRCYWEEFDSWEMKVQTPNGYALNLEKHGPE